MWPKRSVLIGVCAWGIFLASPAALFAQGIAGVVKDISGAALPGVTVEASSPALIEKVRAVVSDSQGQYSIVALRPGTYTVTFALPGFSTVRRDGIVLTTGFTANVNADLAVGAITETIVVTSEAPIVDTRTITQTSILTDEAVQAIPSGRTTTGFAQLIPGISIAEGGQKFQDVGGLAGEGNSFVIHGSRDNEGMWFVNGMPHSNGSRANASIIRLDVGQVEEFTLETSGISAEYREGGVALNLVGKEGANRFFGTMFVAYANGAMQGDNADDELRARGVGEVNKLDKSYDYNPSIGGPIIRNRLWYFGTFRYWGTDNKLAGIFWDKDTTDFVYTPDLSRQHVWVERIKNVAARTTWQATTKNKLQLYFQQQPRVGFASEVLNLMPEARSQRDSLGNGNIYSQVLYSAPLTARVLFEGGYGYFLERTDTREREGTPVTGPNAYWPILEASTGNWYNYPGTIGPIGPARNEFHSFKASMSYVTGSHAVKIGMTEETGAQSLTTIYPRDMTLRFQNGVPNRITLQVSPLLGTRDLDHMLGIYANDQWTRGRLTLNLGLRFDYKNSSVPPVTQPAGRFLPGRTYAAVEDVPNWKDLGPRLGAVYDLFGNGRTAVKFSWNRYVGGGNYTGEANFLNPQTAASNSANRSWIDRNGNFIPECDFLLPAENGECGGLQNLNFGVLGELPRSYDPGAVAGWHVRPYNTEMAATAQHQFTDRLGIDLGYYRRSYGNFHVDDNILVGPEDFDSFCLTTPVDARLPGGGGQQLCGFADIKPAKLGQEFTNRTSADTFGTYEDVYDGVDVSLNTRLGAGTVLRGGFSTGRERISRCFAIDSPQAELENARPYPAHAGTTPHLCMTSPPFQTQAKMIASFTLPGDVILAGTLQNTPGPQITATYQVRANQTTLGRLFAGGNDSTTKDVEIVAPGTLFGPRVNQVDLRVSKVFAVGRTRLQANFDLFNVLNANAVLQQQNVFGTDGSSWQKPNLVLLARLVKLGFNLNF
jgi:hypothetical protein